MAVNKQKNLTSRSSRKVIYFIFLGTPFYIWVFFNLISFNAKALGISFDWS